MCRKCEKPFCLCVGDFKTKDIVESYISKLSTIMFIEGISMKEKDFKKVQLLQTDLISWMNNVPMPNIKDVITNSMIIVLRYSRLLQSDESSYSNT
jgi:hypothetical protein